MIDCEHKNNGVVDSRLTALGIRRRRQCFDCDHRWSTVEIDVGGTTRGTNARKSYEELLKDKIRKEIYIDLSKEFHQRSNEQIKQEVEA